MSLRSFPRRTLREDRVSHRIHRASTSPWWFSSDGSGRFDPVGSGRGAYYLAEEPLGAWVEAFRKRTLWAEADLLERSLLSVRLGRDLRLADLTSRRALRFGVTASLGASEDYAESQAFALRAVKAGFDGIRYLVRHDPGQRLYGIALFADVGAPEPADSRWPAGDESEISDQLIAEAGRLYGYRVLPMP